MGFRSNVSGELVSAARRLLQSGLACALIADAQIGHNSSLHDGKLILYFPNPELLHRESSELFAETADLLVYQGQDFAAHGRMHCPGSSSRHDPCNSVGMLTTVRPETNTTSS